MSDSTPVVPASAIRPLPPRANLEFEHKRAKSLLRQLRRGDPNVKLADAQFAAARELGFASWPRLVQYFKTLERDAYSIRALQGYDSEFYDGMVRTLVAEHRHGREWAGRRLAAFVPRFYGQSIADVLASPVTIDDARLVVARQNQRSNWDQLLEDAAAERAQRGDPWTRGNSPFMRAVRAMSGHDLGALEGIVDEHPELLHPSEDDERRGHTLMFNALIIERQERSPEARRVTEWLVSRGMDLGGPLNLMLLGFHGMTAVEVQYLLDRGADVTWTPPNGVSVLEHAILRCFNGKAVDLLAQHITARPRGLWAAAGLGDVADVRRYFDRDGKLTAAAYEGRPPFDVMGMTALPSLPQPDDLEILIEATLVAAMNGRTAVIELLIDRGFPIDYIGWGGTSLLRFAIGHRDVTMTEMLVRRGADLDRKGEWPHASAREFARQIVQNYPDSPELRTILNLCGAGTPEDALAEFERQRPSPPPFAEQFQDALELAGDDAARRGQAEIRGENLVIGLLRGSPLSIGFLSNSGVGLDRLRGAVADRLHAAADRVARSKLPLDADARAIVERAVAIADERRRGQVESLQLLDALVEREPGFATDLVVACGGDLSRLRRELARA